MNSLLVVVGLEREARLVGGGARVILGGRGLAAIMAEKPTALLSFGLCGGLDPRLEVGDLVLGETVTTSDGCFAADAAWTNELANALPAAVKMGVATGPNIVGSTEAKAALRQRTGAGAVDMETHLVAEAASKLGAPFAVLRSVSDRADQALCAAAQAGFAANGNPDLWGVVRTLLARPFDLPSLFRTARNAEVAFKTLDACNGALPWTAPPAAPPSADRAPGEPGRSQ
ncbi:MAG TPA: hypothetical protein VIJ59_03055 [Caulobacteraceae bacterium]